MARRLSPPERIDVSERDLLDALEQASRPKLTDRPRGFYTITELSATSGVAERTLRARLAKLRRTRPIETARVYVQGIDGRVTPVTAYRLPRGRA